MKSALPDTRADNRSLPFRLLTGMPAVFAGACLLTLLFSIPSQAGSPPNRLLRMEILPKAGFTRFVFVLDKAPRYSVVTLPGRKVQVVFHDTRGRLIKRPRSYADSRVSDIVLADRGDRLRVGFTLKEEAPGLRALAGIVPNVLTLDVAQSLNRNGAASMPLGRERVWSGAGKLIHEFDPSLKSDIPFFPTPGPVLRKLLAATDLKRFLQGEEALYRERGAEAEEVFSAFLNSEPPVRAMAAYRLGEAQYLLQKYESALGWFREGERIWPEYLTQSPSIVFSYADSMSRCGKSAEGRQMLVKLIAAMADTKYGPLLLVRLADLLARDGRGGDAAALYKTVRDTFPGAKAGLLAATRLADRRLFDVSVDTYGGLAGEYARIHTSTGDPALKDEALFKWALIRALYGPVAEAVSSVIEYQAKFPSGVFANVTGAMREELLLSLFHELDRAGDCGGLVRLALENRRYLARCAGDATFLPRIADCFRKSGNFRAELDLFSSLAETEWPGSNSAFLYYRIVEDAWLTGDLAMAEGAARLFLGRFPQHEKSRVIRERLGWIQYRNRSMAAVAATLGPILDGTGRALYPESYYYLGKACAAAGDGTRAEKSMLLFLRTDSGNSSRLSADARAVVASARLARGDLGGAMAAYREGYEASRGETREMFLYKMGDLYQRQGKRTEARSLWERLVKEGEDATWKLLATQSLADMAWQDRWGATATSK